MSAIKSHGEFNLSVLITEVAYICLLLVNFLAATRDVSLPLTLIKP